MSSSHTGESLTVSEDMDEESSAVPATAPSCFQKYSLININRTLKSILALNSALPILPSSNLAFV